METHQERLNLLSARMDHLRLSDAQTQLGDIFDTEFIDDGDLFDECAWYSNDHQSAYLRRRRIQAAVSGLSYANFIHEPLALPDYRSQDLQSQFSVPYVHHHAGSSQFLMPPRNEIPYNHLSRLPYDTDFSFTRGLRLQEQGLPRQPYNYYHTRNLGQHVQRLDFNARIADVYTSARSHEGRLELQDKFQRGSPEEVEIVFAEILKHLPGLMVDQHGNHLIQYIIESCSREQMDRIVLCLMHYIPNLLRICSDFYGFLVMRKLLAHLQTPGQKAVMVYYFSGVTFLLVTSSNGSELIRLCLRLFTSEYTQPIISEVAGRCFDIATDKFGCRVLQDCLSFSYGIIRHRLVNTIIANAIILAEHPYGNYVVQKVIAMKVPEYSRGIIEQFVGHCAALSMNKYASHVIETCFTEAAEQSPGIVYEIINSSCFLNILRDSQGNYVIQTALRIFSGTFVQELVRKIKCNKAYIQNDHHGRRVWDAVKAFERLERQRRAVREIGTVAY